MIYEICYYGNPVLRKKAEKVAEITPEIQKLIEDMKETMTVKNGIGLAANQIGKLLSIFIVSFPDPAYTDRYVNLPPRAFINSKLSNPSKEVWGYDEACMSLPGLQVEVYRPKSIEVTALDENGNEFTEIFTGWNARMIMHENDHLNGVLTIDRTSRHERKRLEKALTAMKKKYNK